jgi:PAS domain S-box-containing protein
MRMRTTEPHALASAAAGIGSWEYDVASQTLTWDDQMYVLYGVQRTGRTEPLAIWLNSLHPDDKARCERELLASLEGVREFESDFRVLRPDGEIGYLKAASRALRAADGTPLRLAGVNIDIGQHRRAELQLLETSSQLQTVLDSVTKIAIIATDANLTIKLFNAGAEQLLGYTSEELIGRATPMVLHDPVEIYTHGASGDALQGWAVVVQPAMLRKAREWTYLRKDGGRLTVSQTVVAMHSGQGELLGYVSVARDVSAEKRYEESLRETARKADLASRAKSRFLANMSHEIRTPMNAVIGLSYLLEQTPLDQQQSDFLKKINAASRTLLALINDVLDMSKIEAGELLVEHAPFSLQQVIKDLTDEMLVHAKAKGIPLTVEAPTDLPAPLQGDARRLHQILTNLLSNAIRFTDRGNVVLHISVAEAGAQSVRLCFAVRDTGIGISPAAQARLFVPFSQADASITRRFGGTGLGLSIVKNLVDLMGGTLKVTSTPGQGSEFQVILDFDLATGAAPVDLEPNAGSNDERRLPGVRVLLVDDSDVNLDVTTRILELTGAHVRVARNGLEAVERVQAQPHEFDIVLMDVQMPVMDGYAATGRIRALGLIDLPIIALTAGALHSERQLALSAGMDDFIIKPFDANKLVRSILRHITVAASRAATPIDPRCLQMAQSQGSWPEVEGIDSTLARARLMNDYGMFQSGLKRLLREFSEVAVPATAQDADSLAVHAARMHKLKGIAGTLGATQIQHLAAQAEAACVGGEITRAVQLTTAIREQLDRLRHSAAPMLEAARLHAESVAVTCDAKLAPHLLSDFLHLLRQQNLSAADRFSALSPQLRVHLGKDGFERLRDHIDNLEFAAAAEVLDLKRA